MSSWYLRENSNRFSFNVGPSSPVGMLKSRGSNTHFWTFAALEIASSFAKVMPLLIAAVILGSFPFMTSLTLVASLPCNRHHASEDGAKSSVGIILLSESKMTLNVKKADKNFFLSPTTTTFDRHGNLSLIAFSIGTGAMFSPPAVIINSLILPENQMSGN